MSLENLPEKWSIFDKHIDHYYVWTKVIGYIFTLKLEIQQICAEEWNGL